MPSYLQLEQPKSKEASLVLVFIQAQPNVDCTAKRTYIKPQAGVQYCTGVPQSRYDKWMQISLMYRGQIGDKWTCWPRSPSLKEDQAHIDGKSFGHSTFLAKCLKLCQSLWNKPWHVKHWTLTKMAGMITKHKHWKNILKIVFDAHL